MFKLEQSFKIVVLVATTLIFTACDDRDHVGAKILGKTYQDLEVKHDKLHEHAKASSEAMKKFHTKTEDKLNSIEAKIVELEKSVERLPSSVKEVKESIEKVNSNVETIPSKIASLSTKIDELPTATTQVQTVVKEVVATKEVETKESPKPTFSREYTNGKKVIDGGVTYPVIDKKRGPYAVNTQKAKDFGYGRTPTKNEIDAWNIDVMYYGEGLPEGEGSVEDGDELFDEKCAMCHGDFGAGGLGYPTIAASTPGTGSLKNQRVFGKADGPERVIGTYWPYASTLFWYTQSAMPFPHPKSLSNDEVYALVAYMLSINGVEIDGEELEDEYVLDREKFLKIVMPNVNGFEPEIRGKDGIENVRTYYNNFSNYGNGTRCMTDCIKGEPNVVRIKFAIDDFEPPLSTVRKLPDEPETKAISYGQKIYEANCAVCHATDMMGAPEVGNRDAWTAVTAKGIEKVYHNAINGINGMPPKGGVMDLTDKQLKEVVDYMISESK